MSETEELSRLRIENGINKRQRAWNHETAKIATENATAFEEEAEQLRVQLAGVSVAAMGGTKDVAVQGDYGWSPAYQDTLDLRLNYEQLKARVTELEAQIDPTGATSPETP
jgi:hypothetical protein